MIKPQAWVPPVVFLVVSLPVVLLLNAADVGGEFKVWIAIVAGVLATAFAQAKLKRVGEEKKQ